MATWKKLIIIIFTIMLLIVIVFPILINTNTINTIIKNNIQSFIENSLNGECKIDNLKATLTMLEINCMYISNPNIIAQIDNIKIGISIYSLFIGKLYFNFIDIDNAYIRIKEKAKSNNVDTIANVENIPNFNYTLKTDNIPLPIEVKSFNINDMYIQYDTLQLFNIESVSSISINKKRIAIFYKIFSAKLNNILSLQKSNGEIILNNSNAHFLGDIQTNIMDIDYEFIVYDSTVNINTFDIALNIENMNIAKNSINCFGNTSINGFIKNNSVMLNTKTHIYNFKFNELKLDSINLLAYLKNDSLLVDRMNIFNKNGELLTKGFIDIKDFPSGDISLYYNNVNIGDFLSNEYLDKLRGINGHANLNISDYNNFTFIVDSLSGYIGIDTLNNITGIVSLIDNDIIFRNMSIIINSGYMRLNGLLSQKNNNFEIKTDNIPISIINNFYDNNISGFLSGYFHIIGDMNNYSTSFDLNVDNFFYNNVNISHLNCAGNLYRDMDTIPDGTITLKLINTKYNSNSIDILYAEITKSYKNIFTNLSSITDIGYIEYEGEYTYDFEKQRLSGLIQHFNIINNGNKSFLSKPVYITLTKDTIEFSEAEIRGNNFLIRADILKTENNINGNFRLRDDSLQIIKLFVREDFNGILDLYFNVSGNIKSPVINFNSSIYNFSYEKMFVDSTIINCSYKNNNIILEQFDLFYKNNISSMYGSLNIIDINDISKSEISLNIKLNGIDGDLLSPLDYVFIVDSGVGMANINVSGNILSPDINGDVNINNAYVNIIALGTYIRDINGNAYFNKDSLIIDNIKGLTEKGELNLNGYVIFGEKLINYYYFDIIANGAHVNGIDYVDAYGDCNINVGGSLTRPIIKGNVYVLQGKSDIPFFNLTTTTYTTVVDSSYIDLNIIADKGNVWVKNSFVDIELEGNINIFKDVSRWKITGKANIIRGYYFYIDKKFTVEKGYFELRESDKMVDIFMNIKSEARIRYIDAIGEREALIYLNVIGDLQEPQFSLYSTPPMSMEDIISILSFNVTTQSLNQIQNISKMLPEKALQFYLRNTYLKTISSSLGLDELNLQTNILSEQKSASLSIGKYINKNIFVSYTHDIFSFAKDMFKIEYKLNKNSNIITERDKQGQISAGFQFKLRY